MTIEQHQQEEDDKSLSRLPGYPAQVPTNLPNPDPSVMTTDQMRREVSSLRDQVDIRLDAMDKAVALMQNLIDRQPTPSVLHERTVALDGIFKERFDNIERQLTAVSAVNNEKFEGVSRQFIERDKRTEQLSIADKTAIAAALQAQKEAAGATNESNAAALTKMEANFTKLIDQGQVLIAAVVKNTDEKINDLKGRMDRGEGKTSVSDPAVANGLQSMKEMIASLTTSRDGGAAAAAAKTAQTSFVIAVVVAAVSVGGLILTALKLSH